MSQQFFELRSPRDMLEKAQRELERMTTHFDTDSLFNFFVTAYHVMDYVKACGRVGSVAIDAMYADPDFELCLFLSNKGKHIQLKKYVDKAEPYEAKHKRAALYGAVSYREATYRQAETYVILDGSTQIEPLALAQRLIAKWETFLTDNGL